MLTRGEKKTTGWILKQSKASNASVLQPTVRFASLILINSTPSPSPSATLPHPPLFICTITDRYQVIGESANEEAMLAFHVAASLMAAFTAKDDCSWVQSRIFRSALRCDWAAGDLLKRGGSGHPLLTCFQQIAYIIVYVLHTGDTRSYCPHFCPFIRFF